MLLSVLEAASAVLLAADAAEELTRVRPSEALDVTWLAVSLAFAAPEEAALEAALAASEVVEALRAAMRRTMGARTAVRQAESDMMR